MIGVSVGQTNIFLFRKVNTWFSVKDGNWSDPNTWVSNGLDKKNTLYPQLGDHVWINNNIALDINTTVGNLYGNGYLTINANITATVNGDIQIIGTINQIASNTNLILNGYNNVIINYVASNNSAMVYNGNFSQNIMNLPYWNLTTQNIGTKYQTSNLTIAGNFNQQSNYDCLAYNLTVNGTSTIGSVGACTFYKSGEGNLLFIGNVDFEGNTDLSGGNPNIEFRGGLTIHTFSLKTGTGNIIFTTNNQTINCSAFFGGSWSGPTTIQGAIIVTLSGNNTFTLSTTINGTVADSTFNNSGVLYLAYNAIPMTTGVFNYMFTSTSTLGYVFNGAFTLPYTTYANLVLDGSALKLLGGNTTVNQSLTLLGNGANGGLDTNGYNLTVSTTFTNQGLFSANAFSNILFVGLANWANGANVQGVDLRAGNPNIEFRGGLSCHANYIWTGTGTYTFSTNNQTIDFQVINGGGWAANILISGAISVTFIDGTVGTGSGPMNISGTLNGNNANSIFINKGNFTYLNAQQPMQTGKLYCNQTANTFVYGASGNQDITTPSDTTPGYQNLTLNGSGTKRLLGNVSVKVTYSLVFPAILNSNGYALTNP